MLAVHTSQSKDPLAYLVDKCNLRRGVSSTAVSKAQLEGGKIVQSELDIKLDVSLNTFL
jgi:hypothetical protein